MRIVADAAIPYVRHYFSGLGELELVDGRAIDAAAVRNADILLVRTVTRVDEALLKDSRVRFVASAASGINHIDTDYLADNGIGFASAAGCNARAVAEYVLSCLFVLAEQNGWNLRDRRVGIIGCGHVGSTLLGFLEACGIGTLVCDPPLQQRGADYEFHTPEAVRKADIITLHVPLVRDGAYPTIDMIDAPFLADVRDDAVIINTSRGEVVDEDALMRFLDAHPQAAAVLDVWRGEPDVDPDMLRRVRIGTAHIAGYSLDAKLRGSRMVYDAIRDWLDRDSSDVGDPVLPADDLYHLSLREQETSLDAAGLAVLSGYDVRSDGASMAELLKLEETGRGDYFTGLRDHYPLRREFSSMTVDLQSCPAETADVLTSLGFRVRGS